MPQGRPQEQYFRVRIKSPKYGDVEILVPKEELDDFLGIRRLKETESLEIRAREKQKSSGSTVKKYPLPTVSEVVEYLRSLKDSRFRHNRTMVAEHFGILHLIRENKMAANAFSSVLSHARDILAKELGVRWVKVGSGNNIEWVGIASEEESPNREGRE